MLSTRSIEPVDYLVIGHLTEDRTPEGSKLGGTAAYAALTAHALGLRVGVLTSWNNLEALERLRLDGVTVLAQPTEFNTTFENTQTDHGREQRVYHVADPVSWNLIPESWTRTPIVHLGPVAQEVDFNILRAFPNSFVGLTLQGWLRDWDAKGRVRTGEWPEARFVLERSGAAVVSIEDLNYDESRVEELASAAPVLAVTEGPEGSRLYWNGDLRRFRPPSVTEVDPTGAGDIFATAFFIRMHSTRDPWESARFATQLAAASVTRPGLDGVPTPAEVEASLYQIL